MDKIFEEFIEKLVSECLQGDKFSSLSEKEKIETAEKLRDYFYNVVIDSLLDQISEDQLAEIKDLDAKDPKMAEKLTQFAAALPGFGFYLEDKLKKEMDLILQNGQIPS